jgi:AcrR family transcriptional regulator
LTPDDTSTKHSLSGVSKRLANGKLTTQVPELAEEKGTRQAAQAERTAFTEKRVLDAAAETFARRGLAGTRVREIAEAAGVNVATLYNYYPSKDAMYEAVLERGVRPLTEKLAEFAAGTRELESAHQVVREVMQHLVQYPNFSKLIYLEAISEGEFLPKLARKWFSPLLQQIIGELKTDAIPGFDETLAPSIATLFIHLSFGHFALAPLFKESMDIDPLSDANIENQTRMIELLIDQMLPHLSGTDSQETNP